MMQAYAKLRIDPVLFGTTLTLIGIGTIMIGSSSVAIREGQPLYFLLQHLGALAIGLVGLGVAASIPVDWWYRLRGLVLVGAFALLVLVLVPGIGERVNGAARWIDVGPISLQASELARLLLLLYIASYAVRRHAELRSGFRGFIKPMALVVLAAVLLIAEPDYGATVVMTATSLGVLFIAGARLRDVTVAVLASGAALAALAWSAPYRLARLMTYRDPWADPFDSGYQLSNSLIAFGTGDWLGVGLGASVQKLLYLPEAHTDFVFAVLAEELGLIGATLVIVVFALLVYRAFDLGQRAARAGKPLHGLIGIGIGLMLGMQAAINIGVNVGLLPTKGLTLPLISYGRTSAVVTLIALGLLFRIARETDGVELPAGGAR